MAANVRGSSDIWYDPDESRRLKVSLSKATRLMTVEPEQQLRYLEARDAPAKAAYRHRSFVHGTCTHRPMFARIMAGVLCTRACGSSQGIG